MPTITSHQERIRTRSAALDLSGIDFDDFTRQPLDEDSLRCIRYMHDVEHHTACYLRDLLVTPLHRDPAITTFLSIWAYEEHWHGEALGEVLKAYGEPGNEERVAAPLGALGVIDRIRPIVSQLSSSVLPGATALHLAWGAVNEWMTQAATPGFPSSLRTRRFRRCSVESCAKRGDTSTSTRTRHRIV